MLKVHTVVLTNGSKNWSYLITGTKTGANGRVLPYSKSDARRLAIEKLWDEEFKPYVGKRIGTHSVATLSVMSDAYRWAILDESFEVKMHKVKTIKEGDVVSTKRNADGSKKRHRSTKQTAPKQTAPKETAPKETAPKETAPNVRTLPNGTRVVVKAA